MTPLIQFTILSHWQHVKLGTGISAVLKVRAANEDTLRPAGSLTMTDAAWNMLQEQLCPSARSGQCALEIIEPASDW